VWCAVGVHCLTSLRKAVRVEDVIRAGEEMVARME